MSGLRPDAEIATHLDLKQTLSDGIPFFMSAKEMILSHGFCGVIAPQHFLFVINIATQEVL